MSTGSTEDPYIGTLNPVDSDVPKIPPQAHHKEYSTVAPRTTDRHTMRDEYEGYGNIGDIESAIPAPSK